MMIGAEPHHPTKPGGPYVAVMRDDHGDEWPTGRIWTSLDDARRDGIDTATEWNAKLKPRPWWAFWR